METGLQVARLSDDESDDPEVGPLAGNYTAIQALDTLLRGTRFDYRVVDSRTIAIVRRAAAESPVASRALAVRLGPRSGRVRKQHHRAGRAQRAARCSFRRDVFLLARAEAGSDRHRLAHPELSRHVLAHAGDRDERSRDRVAVLG